MKATQPDKWRIVGVEMSIPLKQQNFVRKTFEPIDNLDRRLITELQAGPRLPIAQLGRRVGLSPPAIAREVAEITECYRITGEDCYFMKLHLHDMQDLEPILDRFTPHGRTTTSIVHS